MDAIKTLSICGWTSFLLENPVCPASFYISRSWLGLQIECISEILASLRACPRASTLLTSMLMSLAHEILHALYLQPIFPLAVFLSMHSASPCSKPI